MIDLDSKTKLCITGTKIVPERGVDGNTPLTATIREWDTMPLVAMITTDALADSAARQEALLKTRRVQNMLIGGVAGGLLDSDGGDDTIVDGVLLGAIFGAICTGDADSPTAQIGLVFRDGSSLAVEVDRSEYTRLQTILASNSFGKNQEGPAYCDRKLTEEEIKEIMGHRENRAYAIYMLAFIAFEVACMMAYEYLGLEQIISARLKFVLVGSVIVLGLIPLVVMMKSNRIKKSLVRSETEHQILDSLKLGVVMPIQISANEKGIKSELRQFWSGVLGGWLLVIGAIAASFPEYSELSRKALIFGAALATYQVSSILIFPKKK